MAPPKLLWYAAALAVLSACDGSLPCGPGTHAEGDLCVADPLDGGGADVRTLRDARVPDAAVPDSAVLDAAAVDASTIDAGRTTLDAGPRTCGAACECPTGTTCTIEGVCEGRECTRRCSGPEGCECGRACIDGFCDFFVGSLGACTRDCDCPGREECADGRCVTVCGVGNRCLESDCSPCGLICDPYSRNCATPGSCTCTQTCFATGYDGQICDPTTNRCTEPTSEALRPSGGAFTETLGGVVSFSTSATSTASGTAAVVTVLLDSPVDVDGFMEGSLTAPDGSTHFVSPSWGCRGGPGGAPWQAEIDLRGSAVPRAGTWTLELDYYPPGGVLGTETVDRIWIYL